MAAAAQAQYNLPDLPTARLSSLLDGTLEDRLIRHLGAVMTTHESGLNAIILANHLGHTLVSGDEGADARDGTGLFYEYKVSVSDQFAFHCGTRETKRKTPILVAHLVAHFQSVEGAQLNKVFNMTTFLAVNGATKVL